jgi:hypothetical protein
MYLSRRHKAAANEISLCYLTASGVYIRRHSRGVNINQLFIKLGNINM